jgi:hypothetical protein
MSTVSCDDCALRRPRLSIRKVITELDLPIVDALGTTIAELEGWYREQEADEESYIAARTDDVTTRGLPPEWDRRPVAHDYCGAIGNTPRLLDIVNLAGSCQTHRAGPVPARSCRNCRHLQRPVPLVTSLAATGGGSPADIAFAKSAYAVAEGWARSEVIEAVKTSGFMREAPRALPVCTKLSRSGRYVVGPIANRTEACPSWERS